MDRVAVPSLVREKRFCTAFQNAIEAMASAFRIVPADFQKFKVCFWSADFEMLPQLMFLVHFCQRQSVLGLGLR
jgi:hypothetical protein